MLGEAADPSKEPLKPGKQDKQKLSESYISEQRIFLRT